MNEGVDVRSHKSVPLGYDWSHCGIKRDLLMKIARDIKLKDFLDDNSIQGYATIFEVNCNT